MARQRHACQQESACTACQRSEDRASRSYIGRRSPMWALHLSERTKLSCPLAPHPRSKPLSDTTALDQRGSVVEPHSPCVVTAATLVAIPDAVQRQRLQRVLLACPPRLVYLSRRH